MKLFLWLAFMTIRTSSFVLQSVTKVKTLSCGNESLPDPMKALKGSPLIDSKTLHPIDRTAGLLVLVTVPLAWGTYGPVVKYMYQVQPVVPGIVFSAAYYIVASVVLNVLSRIRFADKEVQLGSQDENIPLRGGLELGTYLFVANVLQVKGLESVPSGRAGFIVQLTTIMVPLMSAALGNVEVSLLIWSACFLAFAGVITMGLDGNDMDSSLTATISQGDLLIVASAVLYSLHVVRLSGYAAVTAPLKLAASKASVEAALSVIVVYALWRTDIGGPDVANFFKALRMGWSSGDVSLFTLTPAIVAVFWTGLVTCAYTIYAQSYGQSRVSPTEANLVYTIQPLFTTLFAFVLLGETLGPRGLAGAALIAVAVFLVANTDELD